jgi:hypothetical protein
MGILMDRRSFLTFMPGAAGILLAPTALAEPRSVQLAVIVAKDSALQDIDLPDLRRLFGGEPVSDPRGRKLIPFNHPARSPDRVGFDRIVLGLDANQVAKYWIDRKIRAQPGPPRTLTSLQTLLSVITRLPGAVAYLRPEYMNADVRALSIGRKALSSRDYPIVFAEQ